MAQEQRAALEGTVRDGSGGVVVEARVEARHLAGSVLSTVTDRAGIYRFPAVRPGQWTVTAAAPGFRSAQVDGIELALGQLLRVDLLLEVGALTEEVTVSQEPPLIDVSRSARFTSLRGEAVEKLPSGRDFTSLVTRAPGANWERKSGGLSIDGATEGENRYMVDGVETTGLWSGESQLGVVTDFVEEVQVESSGFAAEYGGATGGVVNVLTKSGTNQWRGSVWSYLRTDALGYPILKSGSAVSPAYADGRPSLRLAPDDPSRAEYVTYPKDDVSVWEPGFSLGGPLVRDRLWFFAAYNPARQRQNRTVTLLADGSTVAARQDFTTHHGVANVSAQLGAATRARVAFNLGRKVWNGVLPQLDGVDAPDTLYDIRDVEPNWSLSASLDHVVSSGLLFSLRGGYYYDDYYNDGVPQDDVYAFRTSNEGMAGVPQDFQHTVGFRNVFPKLEYRASRDTRLSFQADVTWFTTAAGEHALRAGVLYNRIGEYIDTGNPGNVVNLYWNRSFAAQRGPFGYYSLLSNDVDPERGYLWFGDLTTSNWALFLQDSWTIGRRLTLNLGLRAENEKVPSFATDPRVPKTAIEFSFRDKLAPRLGFAWDVKGDGRTKLHGSWGIFYDVMKLWMPLFSLGGIHGEMYIFALDTPEWPTLADTPGCPPSCPGELLAGPFHVDQPINDPDNNLIDPDIAPHRLQEATFGIERALTPTLSLSARYVHKQLDRAVEDIGSRSPDGNIVYSLGNPGFGRSTVAHVLADGTTIPFPKARRNYDAVELSLHRRLSQGWSLRASYTWSRLWGNYTGLANGDANGGQGPNVHYTFDNPIMMFDEQAEPVYGRLPTDRPHQLKAQLVHEFHFGTSLGLGGYLASGTPITRVAAFLPPWNAPVMYQGRGSDGRTPAFSQLDLQLQHRIDLGGGKALQLLVNLLNVFDQRTVVNRVPDQLERGQSVVLTEDAFFAGIDTGALIAEQELVQDPRFLRDGEFQLPREVRLGVRLVF